MVNARPFLKKHHVQDKNIAPLCAFGQTVEIFAVPGKRDDLAVEIKSQSISLDLCMDILYGYSKIDIADAELAGAQESYFFGKIPAYLNTTLFSPTRPKARIMSLFF